MMNSKLLKITSLAACISMLAAAPVFAGNVQGVQNGANMQFMQNGQGMQNMQNGQGMQNMQNGQGMQNNGQQQQQQLSNAAQFMVNKGILKGDTSGNYSMSSNVKRGDMSLMMVRAFGLSEGAGSGSGFSDVSASSYYHDAVNVMQSLGIAQGDGQNFRPGSYMTLQEAILFVERALESAGVDYAESDLTSVFEGRSLSEYATREDVSALLYAVLGEDYLDTAVTEAAVTIAATIAYTTDENTAIAFDGDDFNDVCEDATDETLDYVKFTLPSSSYGKLYYGYDSEDDYDGKVTASGKYYYDEDDGTAVSDITFVPTDDYTGTVRIKYTGVNADGDLFTGTVKITVE